MASTSNFLAQSTVFLAAAVICVPIAKRIGLGSVLGYLIAGMLIGPFVIGFVGEEGEDLMHFAEFGVVIMLFLIGLELEPNKLWRRRKQILGVGMSQVVATTLIVMLVCMLLGLVWQTSLAVALALSLSSTAIVLQTLAEKDLMQSEGGQNSFSVLLFQDIAVIPILAVLPLLALKTASDSGPKTPIEDLPVGLQTLAVLGAVVVIILAGRFLVVPLLRVIARSRVRELFTASALLIVVSIALLMQMVGLSAALGTFLAGVILANSEYRHELENDLEPIKGLLLGLFFIAVGASIDFQLIAHAAAFDRLFDAGPDVDKVLGAFWYRQVLSAGFGSEFSFCARTGASRRVWFCDFFICNAGWHCRKRGCLDWHGSRRVEHDDHAVPVYPE